MPLTVSIPRRRHHPYMHSKRLGSTYYSFIDPKRMNGWVGHVGWHTADSLPGEGHPSTACHGAGQLKFAGHRPISVLRHQLGRVTKHWDISILFTHFAAILRQHFPTNIEQCLNKIIDRHNDDEIDEHWYNFEEPSQISSRSMWFVLETLQCSHLMYML